MDVIILLLQGCLRRLGRKSTASVSFLRLQMRFLMPQKKQAAEELIGGQLWMVAAMRLVPAAVLFCAIILLPSAFLLLNALQLLLRRRPSPPQHHKDGGGAPPPHPAADLPSCVVTHCPLHGCPRSAMMVEHSAATPLCVAVVGAPPTKVRTPLIASPVEVHWLTAALLLCDCARFAPAPASCCRPLRTTKAKHPSLSPTIHLAAAAMSALAAEGG